MPAHGRLGRLPGRLIRRSAALDGLATTSTPLVRRAGRVGGSEAGAALRSAGEPAYPMYYIGAGEGLRPFEPRPGGVLPWLPPSLPPLPSPTPMTEASMTQEATPTGLLRRFGEAFDHNGEGSAL